jgi:hypothetical protein
LEELSAREMTKQQEYVHAAVNFKKRFKEKFDDVVPHHA